MLPPRPPQTPPHSLSAPPKPVPALPPDASPLSPPECIRAPWLQLIAEAQLIGPRTRRPAHFPRRQRQVHPPLSKHPTPPGHRLPPVLPTQKAQVEPPYRLELHRHRPAHRQRPRPTFRDRFVHLFHPL